MDIQRMLAQAFQAGARAEKLRPRNSGESLGQAFEKWIARMQEIERPIEVETDAEPRTEVDLAKLKNEE